MQRTIRKIIVGDNYTHNIKYVKGVNYKVGDLRCKLIDFIQNEDKSIDIYVSDGDSTFIWKTIKKEPLEVEYDVNFK